MIRGIAHRHLRTQQFMLILVENWSAELDSSVEDYDIVVSLKTTTLLAFVMSAGEFANDYLYGCYGAGIAILDSNEELHLERMYGPPLRH